MLHFDVYEDQIRACFKTFFYNLWGAERRHFAVVSVEQHQPRNPLRLINCLEPVAKPHKFFNVTMTQASWKKATNVLI
jgi:hypothetical protein